MTQTSERKPYVCPPDAGPAWRAADEAGCDMAELEKNLKLTPEQRIEKLQRILDAHFERAKLLEKLIRGQQLVQRLQNAHPH